LKIKMSFNEALDLIDLKKHKTQHTRSVKLRQSTYDALLDIKKANKYKSMDDVIVHFVTMVALEVSKK
jgi:hypothetical protein